MSVVAVDPSKQGNHIGSALVQYGIDLCNQTGLPLYLESSPAAYKMYQKLGFETLPEKVVHKAEVLDMPTDVEVPLMVRMPTQAGSMTFEEWRRRGFPPFQCEKSNNIT